MTLKVVFHISILLISLYLYYLLKYGVAFVIIMILIDRTMGINIESFGIFKLNFNTGKRVFINAIFGSAKVPLFGQSKNELEHIRWRAIANPHALEEI